jgi:hypothetical protein
MAPRTVGGDYIDDSDCIGGRGICRQLSSQLLFVAR